MPIPGFSSVAPAESITAAEAVAMVMGRFKSSACTEEEACAWLSEQVGSSKLKLVWADTSPEYLCGLHLTGEGFVFIPGLPGARVIDELDWRDCELRRWVRYPEPVYRDAVALDLFKLTFDDRLAHHRELEARHEGAIGTFARLEERKPEEWVAETLTYPFSVRRASLVAILDAVPVPLLEAAEIVADRLNTSDQKALYIIVEAAATNRIKLREKPEYISRGDRIRPRVWLKMLRGEAMLSAEPSAGEAPRGSWSDIYVFRVELERLVRDLTGDAVATQTEAESAEPTAAPADRQAEPGSISSEMEGESAAARDTVALRGKAKQWLTAYVVAERKHRDRDSTLMAMRVAHPGLGVRGSRAVWGEFAKENPYLRLSRPGAKSKRNTSN